MLKREPKDFSLGEIKREIHRGEQIRNLYRLAEKLLPHLLISNESIKYYASLVTYYSVFRLKRFDQFLVYLYLICFVYHRYQRLHDNLLLSLIYNVRQYADEAKAAAKERVYECRTEGNENLRKAGQVLKLFTDDSIAENTPFCQVQAKAFSILERQKLDFIADHITTNASFDETAFQWEHVDKLSHQFKRNLRPILSTIDFDASLGQNALIEAVHFLKTMFQKRKSLRQHPPDTFPTRFIPENTKRYLYGQDSQGRKQFLVDRYEFLVYRLLHNGLLAGDIFCRDSVRFRSFEDDLIDDQKWQEKEKLIDLTDLTILKQPIQDKVSDSLYGFKHPSQYEDMMIKPIRKINTKLIIPEWENIQRIMVSLALKTTTQSIIISKLSNYARKNKTRRALWEYDNIFIRLDFSSK